MRKELVISSNRHETKLAILEDDQLVEIYFQRANEYSLAGRIHKGRVTRVLPGMQSAFVDLGLERDTFLYVSDFFDDGEADYDRVASSGDETAAARVRSRDLFATPPAVLADPAAAPMDAAPASEPAAPAAAAPSPLPVDAAVRCALAIREVIVDRDRRDPRTDHDPRGDRGGRRSRRRRTRGRGFPENKYASPETAAPPYAPSARAQPCRCPRHRGRSARRIPGIEKSRSARAARRITGQVSRTPGWDVGFHILNPTPQWPTHPPSEADTR